MSEPMRILVIRMSALGDVLLATPAIRALKRRFPSAEIDWLVDKAYLPLVEANPHAKPLLFDRRGRHAGPMGWLRLTHEVRERNYDLMIDLQSKVRSRLLRSFAGETHALKKRGFFKGLASLVGREQPYTRRHAVDQFLRVLGPLEVVPDGRNLELVLTPPMVDEADRLLGPCPAENTQAERWVGIAPGAAWATKCWAPERFAAVTAELQRQGFTPVLLGGPSDTEVMEALRAALPEGSSPLDTMALSVGGLAAVIARCRLVLSGDTGPAHIAAALQIPSVAIFGPTSPERWRPLSLCSEVVRLPLPCSPCSNHGTRECPQEHHECMKMLPVQQVMAAVTRALERAG